MKEWHLARSFNLTFRYIDVVLSLNNPRFGDYLRRIYPKRTWIKEHHIPCLVYLVYWPTIRNHVLLSTMTNMMTFYSVLLISRSWRHHLKSSTVVILNLLTNMVCPFLPMHLVFAPVFGGVRVAHVPLVLCVFSFISYVLLVAFVSVFLASSLFLDSWVLDFALTVVTLDFTFT